MAIKIDGVLAQVVDGKIDSSKNKTQKEETPRKAEHPVGSRGSTVC